MTSADNRTCAARVDAPDLVFEIRLLGEVLKDALGHGRAANVAEAHK